MNTPAVQATRSRFARPEIQGALLVGVLALVVSALRTLHEPSWPTDLDQWYYAARAWLEGRSPYDAVGPARSFEWGWSLNYPLSTVLMTVPLTVLPLAVARVVFSAAGGAVLGYALGKDHFRRMGLVLSAAFVIAVSRNQWSPFITAAYFVPLAVVFLAAKPNLALAFLGSVRTWQQARWLAAIGVVIVGLSLLARPTWPMEWLDALRQMQYIVAPVTRPWGVVLLLALFKWRRTDARIFLALACVPQTPSLYDLLPLFVVMRTLREVSILAFLTHALFVAIVVSGPFATFDRYAYVLGNFATFMIYLPVTIMLLRRPNVGRDEPASEITGTPWRLKTSVENLTRFDATLLVLNGAASLMLVWVTLTTRRI